jgi:nucleoside-diphosphate-sugar epimerase
MNILLTGASGFLGQYLIERLVGEGEVTTLGRTQPHQSHSHITADLAVGIPPLEQSFQWVVHNAGKAHVVPRTPAEKQAFFDVNVKGTANLLKALESAADKPKAFVLISTVAVYGLEQGEGITETQSLAATDPYGRSKVEAEQIVGEWCRRHHVTLTILRLPLVVGLQPPGNLGAMIKGIEKGFYFGIGKSAARKSMVLAEDVANIIPPAATVGGIYHLTDGYHPSFAELENLIATTLQKSLPKHLPFDMARAIAIGGDLANSILRRRLFPLDSRALSKITRHLIFDDWSARRNLNWHPSSVLAVPEKWLA